MVAPPDLRQAQQHDGENLQTPDEHQQGEKDLVEARQQPEVPHGADQVQAGADVAQAAQGGAGFDPNAAQQGNASANNDDNVVDADYEVVDDDKK